MADRAPSGAVTARRPALNTALQIAGEAISRLLSFALYAVMAHRLGLRRFGEFSLGLSLIAFLALADTAIDDVLARNVARDRTSAQAESTDALTTKLAVVAPCGLVAICFTFVADYPAAVIAVVAVLLVGSIPEAVATTIYAARRGLEDFRVGVLGLVIMRAARAGLGILALLAGAGVVGVASAYAIGGAVALTYALVVGRGGADQLPLRFSTGATRRVLSRVWPLVIAGLLETALFALGPIVLSLVKGTGAVGAYGAAIRLALVGQFLSVSLSNSVLPVLARSGHDTEPTLGNVVESTLKAATLALLPIALALALFARPIVRIAFGSHFAGAVLPTRVLAALVFVWGLSYIAFAVLLAHDEMRVLLRVPALIFVANLILLAALVPMYSATGCALAILISETAYGVILLAVTLRLTGRLSIARVAGGAFVGSAAMVAVVAALGVGLQAALAAAAAYIGLMLSWEKACYPADLQAFLAIVRRQAL